MNALDLLMGADTGEITRIPTGQYEIKRLSELFGEPFIVEYRMISAKRLMEITDMKSDRNGDLKASGAYEMNILIAAENITSPPMKDAALQARYKAATPTELVEKLFRPGEISRIAKEIISLASLDDPQKAEDEVKN